MPPSAAVLDTPVLISGCLTRGPPRRVLDLAEAGRFRMVLSVVILEEMRRSLSKPRLMQAYGFRPEAIDGFADSIAAVASVVAGDPSFVSRCRDPNDHTAVAAVAPVIVSGDKDLLDLNAHAAIRNVTPRQFLDMLTEP